MLRSIFALLALLTLTTLANGQPAKKDLAVDTTELRTLAQTNKFQHGRPISPLFTPDGKAVLFLRSEPRSAKLSLFEFDVATGKTRELISPADVLKGGEEKLSPEEKAARERMRVSAAGFTGFQLSDDGTLILLRLSGRLYTLERETKKVRELPTGKGFLARSEVRPRWQEGLLRPRSRYLCARPRHPQGNARHRRRHRSRRARRRRIRRPGGDGPLHRLLVGPRQRTHRLSGNRSQGRRSLARRRSRSIRAARRRRFSIPGPARATPRSSSASSSIDGGKTTLDRMGPRQISVSGHSPLAEEGAPLP